jgi:hypothetical protein
MSIIENSEIQVGYVMQCIDLIAKGRVRTLTPRRDVALREKEAIRAALRKTVWQAGCQSWYLDANGEAITWPFPMKRFREDLRAPVLADYETT